MPRFYVDGRELTQEAAVVALRDHRRTVRVEGQRVAVVSANQGEPARAAQAVEWATGYVDFAEVLPRLSVGAFCGEVA